MIKKYSKLGNEETRQPHVLCVLEHCLTGLAEVFLILEGNALCMIYH